MPDEAVRIDNGYHLIDSGAWVRQRTGDRLEELTDALREFTRHPVFAQANMPLDTAARMQLWVAARGWTSSEETTHYHQQSVLTEPVTVILAAGTDRDRSAYALVQVGDDPPEVYRDLTTDDGYWLQVEPVDIVCPTGHRWTWLERTELLDDNGAEVAFVALFGSGRGAPYAECRDCQAFDDDNRDEPCPCESRHTIYCPTCDQRCRLELTAVPTYPGPCPSVDAAG